MKQTSVAAPDYSSTSGQTRRSYVDRSWQSWYMGSEDHEPLIAADDYVCRPTAGRTSMPGMVVPHAVLTARALTDSDSPETDVDGRT